MYEMGLRPFSNQVSFYRKLLKGNIGAMGFSGTDGLIVLKLHPLNHSMITHFRKLYIMFVLSIECDRKNITALKETS